MKKLIIGTMLAVGMCYANLQHTWEIAQEFNESVLKKIEVGWTNPCYIFSVYEEMFSVSCEPDRYIYELPYTYRDWKIVKTAPGYVIYSNEY